MPDAISYDPKEMFDRFDRKLDALALEVKQAATLQMTEIRDVRHRVTNLEAAGRYRDQLDAARDKRLDTHERDMQALEGKIDPIHEYVISQRGVDSYKKWLIATWIAILALIVTLIAVLLNL